MFIVFHDSKGQLGRVSKFENEEGVLGLVKPEITINAVRRIEQEGPAQEYDINFIAGQLKLLPRPITGSDEAVVRLDSLERAIRDFGPQGGSADDLIAWLESVTHFELEPNKHGMETK